MLSPQSCRSSASFLLFLSLFTGGGAVSGDCIGVIGCSVEATGGTVIGGAAGVACVACLGATGATVSAPPRPRRRRRIPAATEVSAGAGKLQDTDSTWRPAAWLKTTRAFKPLARHRSYSAKNSVAMPAGCSGRVCSSARAPSPRTTLPTWGRVTSCRGGDGTADNEPVQPAHLQPHRWGRQDGEGPSRVTVQPVYLPQPQHGGGEEGDRSSVRVEGREPSLTGVSSELRGVSSELRGVSSELRGG